jgi:DNA modification methylase
VEPSETRNKRSVWNIATQSFSEAHFATFPEALVEPCVLAGCAAGGTVLDPFGGAMTTTLVAQNLHCKGVAIELSAEYIEIGMKRLAQEVFAFGPESLAPELLSFGERAADIPTLFDIEELSSDESEEGAELSDAGITQAL